MGLTLTVSSEYLIGEYNEGMNTRQQAATNTNRKYKNHGKTTSPPAHADDITGDRQNRSIQQTST